MKRYENITVRGDLYYKNHIILEGEYELIMHDKIYIFHDGQLHNECGPAVGRSDGTFHGLFNIWFVKGIPYTFDDYKKKTGMTEEDEIILRLKYGNI